MKNKILIYGASGYTAKLFTSLAIANNLNYVLAGRSEQQSLNGYRQFSLEKEGGIDINLTDIKLVINFAGPFYRTNKQLIEACIRTKTHYIDIAGEYSELKAAHGYNEQALDAGIMIMPGSGFGVVPTDIAATLVKQKLPDADKLIISYITIGGASRGTLYTILKDINKPGIKIVNGKYQEAMPASSFFEWTFKGNNYKTVYNPWRADLFTANLSTDISNIETFSNFPGFIIKMMQGKLNGLRKFLLNVVIKILPEGPSKKQLQKGKTLILALGSNSKNESSEFVIEGPEAYVFTIETIYAITKRILNDQFQPGFQTPSIYGKELITEIKGVEITNNN